MGFKDLIISVMLIGLFTFALISVGVNMAISNHSPNNILNDSTLSKAYSNLNNTYSETGDYQDVNNSLSTLEGDQPLDFGDGITLTSIVSITKTMTGVIKGTVGIINSLISTKLGIPPVIIWSALSIVLLLIIVYIWRLIRTGE